MEVPAIAFLLNTVVWWEASNWTPVIPPPDIHIIVESPTTLRESLCLWDQ